MDSKELQDFMEVLPKEVFRVLKVLALSPLLNDELAANILYRLEIDNPFEIIKDLKTIPGWHDRTTVTWVIDEDVQVFFSANTQAAEKERIYEAILREMEAFASAFSGTIWVDDTDYYSQILRTALRISRVRVSAIEKIGKLIAFARRENNPELTRVCYLYLEEAGIVFHEGRGLRKDE